MRIIAGSKARMSLLPPQDRTTRPITDRVKESLFSILQFRLAGAQVADLFCGTGSMGLEAVSRGAAHAIMVDADRDALNRLGKNIDKLGFAAQTTVVRTDIFRAGIPSPPLPRGKAGNQPPPYPKPDLVFVDPPYRLSTDTATESPLGQLLQKIAAQVTADAVVIVRHHRRVRLLDTYAKLHLYDRREYGTMAVSFLESKRA